MIQTKHINMVSQLKYSSLKLFDNTMTSTKRPILKQICMYLIGKMNGISILARTFCGVAIWKPFKPLEKKQNVLTIKTLIS